MSILLGVCTDHGSPASETILRERARATARYAIGSAFIHLKGRIGMAWQPYGSHPRFDLECGPVADDLENVLSFDGRLDNFRELAHLLGLPGQNTSDAGIALAAFARWGKTSFGKFIGDWAIVAWSEREDTLFLGRDHAGTRTLYYRAHKNELEWATHLDTFFFGTDTPALSEPYIAAYLAGRQIRELTPYRGIFAVPPGCSLAVRHGALTVERHWSPFGGSELEYASEQEYDEHFLTLFRRAVERRSEDVTQVVAELSGGMDSTAIVCMSDHCRRAKDASTPLFDTISYFDDEEASLDERRYFSITEAYRGKVGVHLDMAFSQRTFLPHDATHGRYLLPGADSLSIVQEEQFQDRVWSRGYRAILSGIGGDELLGGVPDRYPELAGYLTAGEWGALAKQSLAWSLVNRDPIADTLVQTVRWTAANYAGRQGVKAPPPWMSSRVRELVESRDNSAHSRGELQQYTPRQLDNARSWAAVMETLPHRYPRILARPEYRYPYLDKDLVTYLLRVPRAQLLRPGRRRAMMRRALIGIMPNEILERKRKAFQVRAPFVAFRRAHEHLRAFCADSLLAQANFIKADELQTRFERLCAGNDEYAVEMVRTIFLELWLRSNSFAAYPKRAAAHQIWLYDEQPPSSIPVGCKLTLSDGYLK